MEKIKSPIAGAIELDGDTIFRLLTEGLSNAEIDVVRELYNRYPETISTKALAELLGTTTATAQVRASRARLALEENKHPLAGSVGIKMEYGAGYCLAPKK